MDLFPLRRFASALAILLAGVAGCGPSEDNRQPDGETAARPAKRIAPVDTEAMRFRHLTVETGLSQNAVFDIVQDREGFVWLSTKDGLNRHDGREVTVYRHDPFDESTLPSSYVTALLESADGHLWVGTLDAGVARLDPATGEVVRYENSPRFEITALAEDTDGALWIGTRADGLYRLGGLSTEAEVTAFRHDPADAASLSDDRVRALLADREGTVWIGTLAGLDRHEGDGFARFNVAAETDLEDPAPDRVTALTQTADGTIWAATLVGLSRLDDPATGRSTHLPYPPRDPNFLWGAVIDLAEGPDGAIWVASQHMLNRLDPETGRYTYTVHDAEDPESLTGNYLLSLLWDRSNVLWVGTNGYGLNLYDAKSARFGLLDPPNVGASASWATFSARALFEDRDGRVWVNANDQLFVEDESGGDLVPFRPEGQIPPDWATPGWSMLTTSFAQDREGAIWLTDEDGLHRYDPNSRQYRVYRHDPAQPESLLDPKSAERIRGVFEDRAGTIWVVTRCSISRLDDPEAGRFRHVRHCPDDVDRDPGGTMSLSMHEDAQGRFWIATETGLLRFDPRTEASTHYRMDPSDPTSLSNDRVLSLLADPRTPDAVLWIGTGGGGLNRFDVEAETFQHITTADGLPNNVVYGVLPDPDGRLWLSTNRGLARYGPRTGAVQTYNAHDGLQSNEFNTGSFHRGASGTLYFGGVYGVNVFDPADFEDNPFVPAVALTGLRIGDQPVAVGDATGLLSREPWATETLRLGPRENMVTLSFAALDFSAPEKNRYAYQMEGLDDDWIQAGTDGSATYTNLPPGRYTLRVRGSNNDGVWNEAGVALALTVAPPWWRSWWAYALYGLALGGLATLVYRDRQRRVRLRHELEMEHLEAENLRQLDHAKSQFFANVSHEFRTPLTLTLGPLDDVIAEEYGPLPEGAVTQLSLARRSAGRVLGLINQILDVSRLEAGSTPLCARPLDLVAFARTQVEAFRSLAERRQVQLEVIAPDAPVQVWADPEHTGTILSNVLSNAFKFTPEGGRIRVCVETEEGQAGDGLAAITVRDSGPGIAPGDLAHVFDRFYQAEAGAGQEMGSGIGLALAHDLAELHGGTLTAESTVGFGSTFRLALPLGRDHLRPDQLDDRSWAAPAVTPLEAADPDPEVRRVDSPLGEDRTTVLVADDNADIRAYVRRHLEGAGYRVVEATDGEDALEHVHQHLPDLIVSDVMMPRMDGLGLCRALRADPETDFLPILLLTAKAATEDRLDGLAELCDDYLTKPFEVRELVARVDTLITLRKRLRERFASAGWPSGDGRPGMGEFGDGVLTMTPTQAPVLPVESSPVESADDAFVAAVRAAIRENLSDELFDVGALAEAVGLSRSHLLRRTTALMGAPPSALIRSARLDQAARLLVARAGTVSEIAYGVGFKSVAHFSDAFLAHTGSRPSAYSKELQEL